MDKTDSFPLFAAHYKDGMLHGKAIAYYSVGDPDELNSLPGTKKAEGNFVNGIMDGEWLFYNGEGELIRRLFFDLSSE